MHRMRQLGGILLARDQPPGRRYRTKTPLSHHPPYLPDLRSLRRVSQAFQPTPGLREFVHPLPCTQDSANVRPITAAAMPFREGGCSPGGFNAAFLFIVWDANGRHRNRMSEVRESNRAICER